MNRTTNTFKIIKQPNLTEVHQNQTLSDSFERDGSRVIGNHCKRKNQNY